MNRLSIEDQNQHNADRLDASAFPGSFSDSRILPFFLSLDSEEGLSGGDRNAMHALQKCSARIALSALASVGKLHKLEHLCSGLDLIPALLMTQAVLPAGSGRYAFEHAQATLGDYSVLCAFGYLDEEHVADAFRKSLDPESHGFRVPGASELNSGPVGRRMSAAAGLAQELRTLEGEDAWVLCHCGDVGWVLGEAFHGLNAADLRQAPMTFVLHRNGMQLSGSAVGTINEDPRSLTSSMGIEVVEIRSLTDTQELYSAYRYARGQAREGKPSLIYPGGFLSSERQRVTLGSLGEMYGIESEVAAFAEERSVALDRDIWIPGSLMCYRDVQPMLAYVFEVNSLPGGHELHTCCMKARHLDEVLANPMLTYTEEEARALESLKRDHPVMVVTEAHPSPGKPDRSD